MGLAHRGLFLVANLSMAWSQSWSTYTGLFLYHFDSKKAGESLTRPDIRVSPIRDSYTRLVKTVLEARNPHADDTEAGAGELQPGEMALILDGGKHGNKGKLTGPWRNDKDKNAKNDDEDADEDNFDDDSKPLLG